MSTSPAEAEKHTPTPWEYQTEFGPDKTFRLLKPCTGKHRNQQPKHIGEILDEDDAAFIVEAVNSHAARIAELEKALSEAINQIEHLELLRAHDNGPIPSTTTESALKIARAALRSALRPAPAEGEQT